MPIPKQIILVDDCSTDGTRDILRELAAERARPDGRLPRARTRARGRPCAPASARHRPDRHRPGRRPRVRPRPVPAADPADRRGQGRRRLRLAVHRRDAPGPLLLALAGQQVPDPAVEHVHQPEPDRHGGLLQGLPPRGDPGDHAEEQPVRVRARGDGQGGPVPDAGRSTAGPPRRCRIYEMPVSYNGRDYQRGQEDRLEGRRPGPLLHRPLRLSPTDRGRDALGPGRPASRRLDRSRTSRPAPTPPGHRTESVMPRARMAVRRRSALPLAAPRPIRRPGGRRPRPKAKPEAKAKPRTKPRPPAAPGATPPGPTWAGRSPT